MLFLPATGRNEKQYVKCAYGKEGKVRTAGALDCIMQVSLALSHLGFLPHRANSLAYKRTCGNVLAHSVCLSTPSIGFYSLFVCSFYVRDQPPQRSNPVVISIVPLAMMLSQRSGVAAKAHASTARAINPNAVASLAASARGGPASTSSFGAAGLARASPARRGLAQGGSAAARRARRSVTVTRAATQQTEKPTAAANGTPATATNGNGGGKAVAPQAPYNVVITGSTKGESDPVAGEGDGGGGRSGGEVANGLQRVMVETWRTGGGKVAERWRGGEGAVRVGLRMRIIAVCLCGPSPLSPACCPPALGIGRALAEDFLRAGDRVVVCSRTGEAGCGWVGNQPNVNPNQR